MKTVYNPLFYFFALTVFLSACSSPSRFVGPSGSFDKDANIVSSAEAQIVLFREDHNDKSEDSILVRSDGHMLGGLVEDSYLPVTICPGEHTLNFEITGKTPNVQNVDIIALNGTTTYMGVSVMENGAINVNKFSEEQALKTLKNNEYQSFLINRKVEKCVPPTTPVKLKDIELSADALFDFDGATLTDLVARDQLNKLVEQINETKLNILDVVVVGHTDRLGDKKYNQTLSEQRAKTVANYLISNGVKGKIKSIGFGSAQPVTTQCSSQLSRDKLIKCLQPDRRVNVELWGNYEVVDDGNSDQTSKK